MDPPLISETAFTAANPSSYSLSEIWPFPSLNPETNGGSLLGLRVGELGGGFGSSSAPAPAEESTVTEQSGGGKKRRHLSSEQEDSKLVSTTTTTTSNGGVGSSELNDQHVKRMKTSGSRKENSNSKSEMESNSDGNKPAEQSSKLSEPPKDYIHVRARRGQATDSHSLAERARREKISERMKLLQDLVPGCNKIIGKALVLDEIINYVQSLQQQVEFLSMKLEAVNSRVHINPAFEGFNPKDLAPQPFDASGMMFGQQTTREYVQGSQPEWLHMHVGGGFERAT